MEDMDRHSLALALLERDPDAHMILADILEEGGDRGGAEWARRRKNQPARRVDLALSILPLKTVLLLGCDFVDKRRKRNLLGLRMTSFYGKVIRKWLQSAGDLDKFRENLMKPRYGSVPEPELLLRDAGLAAARSQELQGQGEYQEAEASSQQANLFVRRCVKAIRAMHRDASHTWQHERMMIVLREILQSGNSPSLR